MCVNVGRENSYLDFHIFLVCPIPMPLRADTLLVTSVNKCTLIKIETSFNIKKTEQFGQQAKISLKIQVA